MTHAMSMPFTSSGHGSSVRSSPLARQRVAHDTARIGVAARLRQAAICPAALT